MSTFSESLVIPLLEEVHEHRLTRWFFRTYADGTGSFEESLTSVSVMGTTGDGLSILGIDDALVLIQIKPEAFKVGQQTWHRKDIKAGIYRMLSVDLSKMFHPTYLMWSCLDTLLPVAPPTVMSQVESEKQAADVWGWIWYIASQDKTVQRNGGLDVDSWLKKESQRILPSRMVPPS